MDVMYKIHIYILYVVLKAYNGYFTMFFYIYLYDIIFINYSLESSCLEDPYLVNIIYYFLSTSIHVLKYNLY